MHIADRYIAIGWKEKNRIIIVIKKSRTIEIWTDKK